MNTYLYHELSETVHRFIFGLHSDIREWMLGQLENPWEVMIGVAFRVERDVEVIRQVLAHEKSGTQIPNELQEQMRITPVGELERDRIRANEDDNLAGYQYWSAMAGFNHHHLLNPQTKRDSMHRFIFGLRSNIRARLLRHLGPGQYLGSYDSRSFARGEVCDCDSTSIGP